MSKYLIIFLCLCAHLESFSQNDISISWYQNYDNSFLEFSYWDDEFVNREVISNQLVSNFGRQTIAITWGKNTGILNEIQGSFSRTSAYSSIVQLRDIPDTDIEQAFISLGYERYKLLWCRPDKFDFYIGSGFMVYLFSRRDNPPMRFISSYPSYQQSVGALLYVAPRIDIKMSKGLKFSLGLPISILHANQYKLWWNNPLIRNGLITKSTSFRIFDSFSLRSGITYTF
jgi:hypothetical protein